MESNFFLKLFLGQTVSRTSLSFLEEPPKVTKMLLGIVYHCCCIDLKFLQSCLTFLESLGKV